MENLNLELEQLYPELLKDGEKWWSHNERTISELDNIIHLMKCAKYLPNCFWEDICGIHTTNWSSLYSLTERMIEKNYPGTFYMNVKPSRHFLEWVVDNLKNNIS